MAMHGGQGGRATLDLDIAIAITNWDMFDYVEIKLLEHSDIKKDKTQKQRYLYKGLLRFDIVPFGEIKQNDDKIYWPPDESVAMTVLGFEEVSDAAEFVRIDNEFEIEVASLSGLFLLKLFAWSDRNHSHNRDADDFNRRVAGALLLGIDVSRIIKNESVIRKKNQRTAKHSNLF